MSNQVKNTLFNPHTVDENAYLLASHCPQGKLWSNVFKPESVLGKLILGLAMEFYRFEVLVNQLYGEMDINQANELLIEWEKSVGLPDDCFDTTVPIEQRREQVRQKFSNFGGVQTADDFVRVALAFGFVVTVEPKGGVSKEDKHTIIVTILGATTSDVFPLPFPIPFALGGFIFLQCIFDVLAPANVKVTIV